MGTSAAQTTPTRSGGLSFSTSNKNNTNQSQKTTRTYVQKKNKNGLSVFFSSRKNCERKKVKTLENFVASTLSAHRGTHTHTHLAVEHRETTIARNRRFRPYRIKKNKCNVFFQPHKHFPSSEIHWNFNSPFHENQSRPAKRKGGKGGRRPSDGGSSLCTWEGVAAAS